MGKDGQPIYYDTKPTYRGGTTFGIYKDKSCLEEYDGGESIDSFMSQMGQDSGIAQLYKNLQMWDEALGLFQTCQPCIAYNLEKVRSSFAPSENGEAKGNNRRLEEADVNENSPFYCHDYAGYENVNQVRSFVRHGNSRHSISNKM